MNAPGNTWQVPGEDDAGLKAAWILAHDREEPPDECSHGFVLPRDCPNEVCTERAIEWAWYVGRFGVEPFALREADACAATASLVELRRLAHAPLDTPPGFPCL